MSDCINQQKIYQNRSIAYKSKTHKAVNERQQLQLNINNVMQNPLGNVSFKGEEKTPVVQKKAYQVVLSLVLVWGL